MPRVQPDGTFGFVELQQWFGKVIEQIKHVLPKAHARAGEIFVADARDRILDEKPFEENSPLTVALKGSDTPLLNDGDLAGSLTYIVDDWKGVRLGVRSRKLRSGRYLAEVLHNGATLKVTPAMRRAVFAKLRERAKRDKRARSFARSIRGMPAKGVWIIPPRPFLSTTFESKAFQDKVRAEYQRFIDRAVEQARPQGAK